MTFKEQLVITIVDKLLIGLLIAAVALAANQSLERFKSQRALAVELEAQRARTRLAFLAQRLSEFYWPLYLRLEKDNAIWESIFHPHSENDARHAIAVHVETGSVLPNHAEAVRLIETKIHLAAGDADLMEEAKKYMRHVAVYTAMRAGGVTEDPVHFGEPWPKNFFPLVRESTIKLQGEYEQALRRQGEV